MRRLICWIILLAAGIVAGPGSVTTGAQEAGWPAPPGGWWSVLKGGESATFEVVSGNVAMEMVLTVEEVNDCFREASEGALKGILGYEERPLVSVDYVNDPRSCVVDAPSTMVIDGTQVKIYAWYDNEWGYVNRMMDLAGKVAQSL